MHFAGHRVHHPLFLTHSIHPAPQSESDSWLADDPVTELRYAILPEMLSFSHIPMNADPGLIKSLHWEIWAVRSLSSDER